MTNFPRNKVSDPMEIVFSTDEKAVAQTDLKLFESNVKSLVVKFDQEKFK